MSRVRFKDYLNDYLECYHITNKEFASRLGISQKHLIDILSGKQGLSADVIERISGVTNISVEYIYKMEANSFLEDDIDNYLKVHGLTESEYLQKFNYKYLIKNNYIDFTDTESKMDNAYYQQNQEIIEAKIVDDKTNQTKDSHFKGNPERNRILLIGIIVGAIFLFGIAGSALISIAFALFMAILGVCFGILIGGFACLIGAVVCFIKGIMLLGSYLGAGLLILATGFGLLALSLLFFYLDGWIIKLIPKIFKACVKLAREALDLLQQFFNRGGQTE